MLQWPAKEIGDAIGKRKQFDSLLYPMSIAKIYVIISHTKIIAVECNKFRYTFANGRTWNSLGSYLLL